MTRVLAGAAAWLACVGLGLLLGSDGGRPPGSAPHGFDLAFPVARVAAAVAVAAAAMPYLSRWVQRTILVTIGLLAVATMVSGYGLPVSVLASLAVGVLTTAIVHLVFGSPLGLASAAEVRVLLADLGIVVDEVVPSPKQSWGLGKFLADLDGSTLDISVYGRDASDAQLLSKTTRFLLYRDSGPTLTFTRRQQVEHEAYLTLMADRAGARVATVLAAGPAGPAKDALLVTRPPAGRRLAELAPFVLPADRVAAGVGRHRRRRAPSRARRRAATRAGTDVARAACRRWRGRPHRSGMRPRASRVRRNPSAPDPAPTEPVPTDPSTDPVLTDEALDGIFGQVLALRSAGIAHGALSTETIVLADDGTSGLVDMRAAATVATADQLDRDLAATMAATARGRRSGPDGGRGRPHRADRRPRRRAARTCSGRRSTRWRPAPSAARRPSWRRCARRAPGRPASRSPS